MSYEELHVSEHTRNGSLLVTCSDRPNEQTFSRRFLRQSRLQSPWPKACHRAAATTDIFNTPLHVLLHFWKWRQWIWRVTLAHTHWPRLFWPLAECIWWRTYCEGRYGCCRQSAHRHNREGNLLSWSFVRPTRNHMHCIFARSATHRHIQLLFFPPERYDHPIVLLTVYLKVLSVNHTI